jgi:hypothetical protein
MQELRRPIADGNGQQHRPPAGVEQQQQQRLPAGVEQQQQRRPPAGIEQHRQQRPPAGVGQQQQQRQQGSDQQQEQPVADGGEQQQEQVAEVGGQPASNITATNQHNNCREIHTLSPQQLLPRPPTCVQQQQQDDSAHQQQQQQQQEIDLASGLAQLRVWDQETEAYLARQQSAADKYASEYEYYRTMSRQQLARLVQQAQQSELYSNLADENRRANKPTALLVAYHRAWARYNDTESLY